MEIWKPMFGFEHRYEISSFGRIKSLPKKEKFRGSYRNREAKLMRARLSHNGYLHLSLRTDDGKYQTHRVSRLVAQTFIPNPDNKSQVNHIDGNKLNNTVENLEWCTPKENTQHAIKIGLIDKVGPNNHRYRHELRNWINKDTGKKEFCTRRDLINKYNLISQNLSAVEAGRRLHHQGWMLDI